MNEQALNYSYELFKKDGYTGTLDQYRQLITSDKKALDYSFNLFKNDGYSGSVNDFSSLISPAVERPMDTKPIVEQPKKKEDTVSQSLVGGSEPTKSDGLGALAVKVQDESILNKKPRQEKPLVSGESTKVVSPKATEFAYQAQKAIETPLPKFVEEQLSAVTPKLIGKTEENVVPQLKYQFSPLGFKFEESGAGDYMIATSPSGESIEISLDITDVDGQKAEANKLNAFLRKGAGTVKNISTLQNQYTEANKKILSQKELDNSLASINAEEANVMARNAEFAKIQNNLEAEKSKLESVPVQQRNNPEYIARVNDFISRADKFSSDFQVFAKDADDLAKRGQQLNKSIGKYTEMKAQQGTWYGSALNAIANKSYYEMAKGLSGVAIDFIGEVISATGLPIMSQEDYEKNFVEQAKKEGIDIPEGQDFISFTSKLDPETLAKIENRVNDAGKKSVRGQVIGDLDKASKMAMESSGVSPEYYRSIEETFVGGALLGALTSIPAMAGGPVARTVLMGSQVLSSVDAEMANDPAFADISENERYLVKGPIAVAVAYLENKGLSNLLNQKGFLNGLVLKALGKVGKGSSYKTFGEVIKNEVDSAVGRGALTLGAGFLAEAETGALQEVADITAKEIYNLAKEKEMFDTPKSVVQFIEQVGRAGLQEGIGAGVLAVPGSVSAAYTGKGFLGMDDAQFAMFENMANDSNIQKGFVARLKSRINTGDITASQGKEILNNYNNSVSLFNSLPDNLDIQGKKEAMNLLKEKRDLERQIDGKDQALTVPQRNRVNEINQQLTKLSEDAIQKQAAGEVPVQPGTGVGQEVAQGEPQAEPQVVAQEGQEEINTLEAQRKQALEANKGGLNKPYYLGDTEGPTLGEFINQEYDAKINALRAKAAPQQVQGEVISQEEIDLETQLAEDLKTIKGTTQPRLRVEGIDIPAEEDINLETIESNLDRLPVYEAKFTTPTVSQDIQVNPLEESKSSTKEGTAESRTIESFDGIPMIVGMSDILSAGTVTDALGNPMETEGGLLYNVLGKNKNAAWAGVTENGATTQYQEALDTYNNNKDLFEKLWAEGKLPNGHVPMAIMRMSDTAVNSNEAVFRYLSPLVKSQPEENQKAALNALKSDIESKKISDKENLIEFISKNNIDSLGKLFDAVVADAKARAKGDLDNTLSLTDRSNLFDLMVSPQGIESASKNPVKELFGSNKDPRSKAFLADTIYDAIGEPAMLRIPRGNIAAVVGIDVLNGGVIPVEHGNYGFGPKGQMIALISNPKHGLDVFPEWKAKAVRVFKKTKPKKGEGKLPTEGAVADQVGGAFFIDKAFRNARVTINPTDVDILAAKLRFAFPDVTVSRTQEEFDNVLNQEGVRTQKSGGVTILGLTKDGKIYLNPNSDSLATPIHEFGHVWIDFLRSKASGKKGDALLAKGLSLVEGTNALKKAIEKYGDNPIAREEALVELMATKGETIINKSKKKQFTNWLNSLFKYVKEFFTTSEQFFKGTDFEQRLKEITLDDFINIGLADLLKGEAVSPKFKAKDAGGGTARESRTQRLAPNGKPSNLNEAQWNQVRTPEFKKWFGDWENNPENASKVIDENGEPLVMYHGSPSVDIESFDINKAVRQKSGLREFANYFTSNKKLADLYRKAPLSKEYRNEIENLLREAKEKQSESRSNVTWDFYAQEIDRLNSIFEGKIYEVFLNVKSPFEFNGDNLDMKGWDNASLDIGYKTVSGKSDLIEALTGNNSAYNNTEYDGVIANDLADMFYGTTNKEDTKQAVKDLSGTVVAIWNPNQIKSATENIGTFDAETSNIRFRIGDNISSFISKARAQGFSEAAIKNVLTRSGVDTDDIKEALAKEVPTAKKVEVTEEFAPGYNRVLNNIFGEKGIVDKSRRNGRSEEETMQNAIDYLQQDTKVYENATDVQREAMVRNLRKEFKKRERRAPSAEKVVGKPKKKEVTVDEMVALKDQIKLEARAAREAKGDLNSKRKALAARIIAARKKGTITAAQARTLVNRISRVNLDNPIMVDRLIEYTDKVFDNANYAADMTELRKLQRQSRSRNHTSMTNVVKQFTSINPENIPLDRIQDYKEALDFLNNRTPFYGNMNDLFDEMLSYQISEEFDAIKTIEALNKKYEDIMSNEVKTVEDYVNLIKDINSFKRKAFQLLQNESITQENYDNLIKMVGKDQQAIEENYKNEITKIKKDLIAEIKNQRPKVSRDFSSVENDLIRKYLELSDADLESLSPEDLFVLNDLLENISNGEIDNFRFNEIISKAYTSDGANRLAKQIDDSKFDMTPEEGTKELSEYESSFWEGLLGMGRAKSGALQKFVVSVFNRAIASYENLTRDGYNEFLKLKKKYKMSDKDMHKIGMLTTYLQEYMAQFDPKNDGIKDIGSRDWFKEILNSKSMRGKYSSGKPSALKVIGLGKSEIDIIEEIWDSLPKDKDGNVDPKAVYDSYMANDGKFFTKNEKGFFDDVMAYKTSEITPKQKFANEINGASFKEIPFHMMRVRLDGGKTQITPTASSDNGVVRIKAGTGKERVSEAVGPIMTNFEKLFITNLEQTGRDYFLSGALKDINNTLSGAKKKIDSNKMPLLDTISGTLSEALGYEFDRTRTELILRSLLSARAATTLLNPIRTAMELGATLASYPLRARTLSGYKELFGKQKEMSKLLEFTNSPLRLRENINNAIDINDGRIEPQSRLTKATAYLSGLPERTMMVTSWMPTFKSEFKDITGLDFDMKKFNDSEAYREKYGKAVKEASAVADAQTEKIIGPTTKAGQRREVRIAPKVLANIIGLEGTVSKNTAAGQILGFFSNYPYREVTEFVNGFKEAAEVIKDEGALSSLSQLQKPLGIALNVAAYGFLGSLAYAAQNILLGDEDDEERGNKILKDLLTTEGFLNELASNAISLAGSKYAAGGKALLQLAATIAIEFTDDEEQKAKIKKLLKDSVFVDPLPVEQAAKFGGRDKALSAIAMYIPQFVILADRYADLIGSLNEVGAIYDKVERKGVESFTQDEGQKVLALNTIFNASQIILNLAGTSIPAYNYIKTYMNKLKEDAGVAEVYKGEAPAKKKSSGGGGGGRAKTINKTDLKRYFPEQYNQLYGEGSPTYEIEQEIKAFEKEQREFKKKMKDQIYGGD
jgi:hypothetical protein